MTLKQYQKEGRRIVLYSIVALVIAWGLGLYLHELANWYILRSFGIASTINFGPSTTTDCPWNCKQPYVSYTRTIPNAMDWNALGKQNYAKMLVMMDLITLNEGDGMSMEPTLVLFEGVFIAGLFFLYDNARRNLR